MTKLTAVKLWSSWTTADHAGKDRAGRPPRQAGRVFGYARFSTTQQADEGESLAVQQRTIAGYAMQHGMTVEKVYVERGVSGSKPLDARPEGSALLRELRPGDTVITPKLDRMFRSALDALGVLQQMKDNGIALHMIDLGGDTTTNGVSKLVFTILSAVAKELFGPGDPDKIEFHSPLTYRDEPMQRE